MEQEIHIIDVHRCTDLPFSLELSPRTFTKCVDAALAPLHLQSIRIMNYIDDWLILAQSHQLAVRHRNVVLAHMKELGLWLNAKKCAFSTTDDHCNEVDRYGKKEAGTGEHLNTFNNQINKHNRKAAAPHGRLPQTKHKLKSRLGPLSSSTVVTPHLTLPKLLRGTRDRWVVQVSFITNYSTGLAPFPRLSAPPHSSQPLFSIQRDTI